MKTGYLIAGGAVLGVAFLLMRRPASGGEFGNQDAVTDNGNGKPSRVANIAGALGGILSAGAGLYDAWKPKDKPPKEPTPATGRAVYAGLQYPAVRVKTPHTDSAIYTHKARVRATMQRPAALQSAERRLIGL